MTCFQGSEKLEWMLHNENTVIHGRQHRSTGGPSVSVLGVGAMSFAGIYGNATVEDRSHAILDAASMMPA